MATIIVEDGSTDNPNANSYATPVELTTYAADRGLTITGDTSQLLIKAMDYMEGLEYQGVKTYQDQPLQWPRAYVYIDTYGIDADEMPAELKKAQLGLAIAIDAGNDPLQILGRSTKREKVDVLEVEYMDGANTNTIDPKINYYLRKLLKGGMGGTQFPVDRA